MLGDADGIFFENRTIQLVFFFFFAKRTLKGQLELKLQDLQMSSIKNMFSPFEFSWTVFHILNGDEKPT